MAHKIFVFVPAFGQTITATTFLTTHALQQGLAMKGIGGGVSTLSFPDIAELRNMATTIWYDALDASHMLFVDADMGFSPDLVYDMLLLGEPLVGTIYPQRRLPLSWAGSGTGASMAERRGNFMKVEGVGMGCTLIHRSVITMMLERMPEIIDPRIDLHPAKDTLLAAGTKRLIRAFDCIDIPDRGRVSEDLSFCIRWNQLGGEVWAAIGHRISHVGPYDYAARYLDTVEAQQRADAQMEEQAMVAAMQERAKAMGLQDRQLSPVEVAAITKATATALLPALTPDARAAAEVAVNVAQAAVPEEMKVAAE
jgi:hypothetical protein